MVQRLRADASPEKHLFISLITRDISIVAAFLDLIDNSINAAVRPAASRLQTAQDYLTVQQDTSMHPAVDISLKIGPNRVEIKDTAPGISAKTATEHVFKFGRAATEDPHVDDRLSVYGIGLKRAIFKIGNKIAISSDHIEGGFDLKLDVADWATKTQQPWTFDLTPRPPAKIDKCGTMITIEELYDDVSHRLSDGVFESQLREAISNTYAFYMTRFVNISLSGTQLEGTNIEIGSNHTSDLWTSGDVSCAVTAGIGFAQGGGFRDRSSGWFIFCNGRAVISADKTRLTGWGGSGLPIFQPKHRPFLGTVFFVSQDAEKLPWTTTKSGINEDSTIWQETKRRMTTVGRVVTSYLDARYTEDGTEVPPMDLQDVAGSRVNMITAAVSPQRTFTPPKRAAPTTTRIQYDANVKDVKRIENYLKRPSMGGSAVGRYTFNYFLDNEVGEA